MQRAVEQWVEQLVDLTGRNQLLYYRTLKRGTLELTDAEIVALSSLLSDRSVRLSQLLPETEEDPQRFDDAVRRARTIHRKALTYFEERGIDILFLALGMATWASATSKATPSSPVLLRPMRLERRGAAESDFDLVLHGDWAVNETLLHLLSVEYDLDLDVGALLEVLETDGNGEPQPGHLFEQFVKAAVDVPDFRIDRRLVVGTFSYMKLPMVKDLQGNVDALVTHDLVSAIAGDEDAQEAVRELRARDVDASLPDYTPPADEFLILDADSSQNLAINAAVAGEPLIVLGPPGTGKSQTIANLIAVMTARGKRVLFVAEKRAAIDAVTKRLRVVGLGDLVMDLHGGVTSRKELAAELAHTIDLTGRIAPADVTELHQRLETTRSALAEYVRELHERRQPWGLSLFEVNAALSGLREAPDVGLRFSGEPLRDLSGDVARQMREQLVEWVSLSEPLLSGRSAWLGAEVPTESEARTALDTLGRLARSLPTVQGSFDWALSETSLAPPGTVDAWSEVLALFTEIEEVSGKFDEEIYSLDHTDLVVALRPARRLAVSRALAHLFKKRYRVAKRLVRRVAKADKLKAAEALQAVTAAQDQLGRWQRLGGAGTPTTPRHLDELAGSHQQLYDDLVTLSGLLSTRDLASAPMPELTPTVQGLLADQATLFRLPRIHQLEAELTSRHLAPLLAAAREGTVSRATIVAGFDSCWYGSIRTEIIAGTRALASFDGALQADRAAAFRESDRNHLEIAAARVRRAVAEHAVEASNRRPDQDRLVRREARKKTRHLTLRRLFDQAPDVLTALRPCWAMSPLVVSQTLPPEALFDLVIFDEASQVLPSDAVPALLRAPQAVVAGDRRQLPPTTFFDARFDDDEEEDDDDGLVAGFESILDVLDTLLGNRMLTWHYRSEDERLIAFSNHNIYASSLITFPGASADRCLTFELIPHRPGIRVDTKSNDFEVERVVELMVEHARTHPTETLGVIAMGIHHANRIEAALRTRLGELNDRGLERFFDESKEERAFVKNLERVQGDERDAIILSIGYSKQPDGRLLYRFGPINQQGGERRLNVAVTRARRRLTLVSNFSHTDMDPSRSSAEGVRLLRKYLQYAESGGLDLPGSDGSVPLNPFELDVKYRLEQAGLTVIPQYGTSGFRIDFAIPHPNQPGRFVLAVEADGASYHASPTTRDRDRLRQQVLERLGWRFHRIWSTDWFNDPISESQKVVASYQQALEEVDAGTTRPRVEAPARIIPTTTASADRRGPRPGLFGLRRSITDYTHHELVALARWIKSDNLLRTEEQMIEEMMAELGFRRRGSRIIAALTRAIRAG